MKNLRSIFVLALFSLALFSCDSDVSIEDPKSETEVVDTKTGNEGNEVDDRDNG